MKKQSLYFTEGSSDKEYHAQIETSAAGFVVNFQYGRRGSTLTVGTKTKEPVSYEDAIKIFDKLIAEKQRKGYTSGEEGTPYVGGDKAERVSGYLPQLLNPVDDEARLKSLLFDEDFVCQEKMDGKCMLLRFDGQEVTAINRTGLTCGAPQPILDEFRAQCEISPTETVIHGECVGDTFHAFDCLVFHGEDIRELGYAERYGRMLSLIDPEGGPIVYVPMVAGGGIHKGRFLAQLKEANKEGIVFKRSDAPYTPGRPNGGGTQLKYKFYEEATFRVAAINPDRRSIVIESSDAIGGYRTMGNCSIPVNHDVPSVGDFVEVRYLYAFENGHVYQPVYKGVRDDKTEADTDLSLKYKAAAGA